jgi:hypothetical protein
MAGSITEFKASFRKEIARPNKFDVNIPVPLTLIPYVNNAKSLNYRCESASLPGRSLATTEQKIGSNPVEKYPYLTTFNDIQLTFIIDDDMSQKVFFDAWLNFINPQYNYNFRYKGDYATVITVNQYDVTNQISYSCNLYDAYPISIEPLAKTTLPTEVLPSSSNGTILPEIILRSESDASTWLLNVSIIFNFFPVRCHLFHLFGIFNIY